ncbi:sec-independent protein translocase protein TatA [Mucilaginibacter gossypiicola]|uniref:Sec-independent protein translocase protein TatA n=1 Tax=Mucilaginibacter gossypiicola TaxID=551995 RepID=A0A1H8SM83_9SPHI|nr:twin-arginine translocase TatA/TatE family subunit [Mucilaginibacter gossypiicola]SEO79900.1 sec-independent protein translocase protein TatA [Mucilaginibacter gossypiicola]
MLSSVLLFLNIGTGEMVLILFAALMLFGGEKLPGLAKSLGKGIREFKDASEDVKREINNQINNYEDRKPEPKKEEAPLIDEKASEAPEATTEHETPVVENTVPNTMPMSGYHVNTPAEPEHHSHINLDKGTAENHSETEKHEEYKS